MPKEKLERQKELYSRRIKRVAGKLQTLQAASEKDESIDAARIDLEDLEMSFKEFCIVQNRLELDAEEDKMDALEKERIAVEEQVRTARITASNFIRKSLPHTSAAVSIPSYLPPTPSKVKRPQITIPKFEGDVKKWPEFKNIFQSLVIDDPTLTDIERMIYLKQAMEGKAADLISNLEVSPENFAKAWEKENRRWDNPRAMVAKHLEALCHLPMIRDEKNIAVIIDAATEAIESLNSLGINDCWQLMLCHLVTSKFSGN